MNYQQALTHWRRNAEPFDLINEASGSVRGEPPRDWYDAYDKYRPSYAAAWAAMMEDPTATFQEDSPLDGLAYGAFVEGWDEALHRVGQLLGIEPERFRLVVALLGEIGRDDIPDQLLADLRRGVEVDVDHRNGLDVYPPDARPTDTR